MYRLVVIFTDRRVLTKTYDDRAEFRKAADGFHRTSIVKEVIKYV